MTEDYNSKGGFFKYLFVSLILHGVLLFILFNVTTGIQPAFQNQSSDYNSQVELIQLEESQNNSQSGSNLIDEEKVKPKEKNKGTHKEVKSPDKVKEEVKKEEDIKQEVDQVKEVPKQNIETTKKEVEGQADSNKKVTNASTKKTTKTTTTDSNKGPQPKEPESKKTNEVLTSSQGKEEVKIAKEEVENKKEASAKKEDKEASTTQQKVKEKKEAPPPPKPQDMIATNIVPSYPKDASNAAIEGDVKLLVQISASGEINKVEILESSGDERLDNIAKRTIEYGWKFNSGKSDYEIGIIVHFRNLDHQQQVDVEFSELSFQEK